MSDRFYTPLSLSPGDFVLDGPEAHHLATVRRFVAGDRLVLFNGDGHDYPAEVVSVGKKTAVLSILAATPIDRELPRPLLVAAALPKGDRAEFLIEKLTEIGTTEFIPLQTERSIVSPREARLEKFSRIVIESSKQCGRNRLMTIHPVRSFRELLTGSSLPRHRWLLHTAALGRSESDWCNVQDGVLLAIGPEGGFTPGEVQAADAAGFRVLGLGPRQLRIETAAIVTAGMVAAKLFHAD